MLRRDLLRIFALAPALAACRQRATIETIQRNLCHPEEGGSRPFSIMSLGVGTVLICAHSPKGTVGVVIPTVPKRLEAAKDTLGLSALGSQLQRLYVCPLHNHWDHASHLDLFRDLLADGGRVTLIASAGDGMIDDDVSGAAEYCDRREPPVDPINESLFMGEVRLSLNFVLQGHGDYGHAAHIGSGRRCNPKRKHCGSALLRSPERTYCLIGELFVGNSRFGFFVNDAASSYILDSVPSRLRAPNFSYDLALIAIADGHLAFDYPEDVIETFEPTEIWWIHWEDFIFRPRNATQRQSEERRPRTAGQLALPIDLVVSASERPGSCFAQHRSVVYFPRKTS
jgi:hypothetical protein